MKDQLDRQHVTRQYAKLAAEYDSRWSFYVRATTEATIKRLPNSLGDVLDIGCGTGALLDRLCQMHSPANLFGVDASAEMLEIAGKRLPSEISLRQSWAEELPFENASFDTVTSCNMFHFIRRPSDALNEMFRVLRPGGRLIITDWCDDYLMCKICDFYLRWFDRSHFKTYGAKECRKMLDAAEANQIQVEKYKISLLWGLMTATAIRDSVTTSGYGSAT